TEALCGGAAAAMVMRFYGATGVTAASFNGLVDKRGVGIRTADLVSALGARGWRTIAGPGEAAAVREHLAARRPVVALVEERPRTFHYVVIVGWFDGRVVVHDPARAPFRILDEADFLRRWRQSDSWMLVATPATPVGSAESSAAEGRPQADGPCQAMVDE